MKAAIITQHGPPESIQFVDRASSEVGESDILVRVKACGLNHLDTWVRRGVPGHKFPLPMVPGSDITGTVEKKGGKVSRFQEGDSVIVNPGLSCGTCAKCLEGQENLCHKWGLLGESQDGGCQEFIAVPERNVYPLPKNLTYEQGACIQVAYVTAWEMLVEKAKIKKGESILIHGAGSGVSIACLQIAKMIGCQIYVTSTSEIKLQKAKTLGADRFIFTGAVSFLESIRNHTGKQGVDVVVDHIGGSTFMDSIKCLKRGGRLVSCGATAGADLNIDWKVVFFKNISLFGSTYGSKKVFENVLGAFARGDLTPVLEQTIPLEKLPFAHAAIEDKKVFGKIVVTF